MWGRKDYKFGCCCCCLVVVVVVVVASTLIQHLKPCSIFQSSYIHNTILYMDIVTDMLVIVTKENSI